MPLLEKARSFWRAFFFLLFGDYRGLTTKRLTLALVGVLVLYVGRRSYRTHGRGRGVALDASRHNHALHPLLFQHEEDDDQVDARFVREIQALEPSKELRVISYSLYGDDPKYTRGAVRNAELALDYFPGWVTRFYVDKSVPESVVEELKARGAQVFLKKSKAEGEAVGMFWRFLAADDPKVDRFIVRDVDSRLNARDRFAVQEWIKSGRAVHVVRDHLCHDYAMSGGMWGAVKGALHGQKMGDLVGQWAKSHGDRYMADIEFLGQMIWPLIVDDQISHDTYFCMKYPNAVPFPTQRYTNFQHVGQVFNAEDEARVSDITSYSCGGTLSHTEQPEMCRNKHSWKFG